MVFEPKLVDKEVGLLSGGEINRLLEAKILASPKEVLYAKSRQMI